MAIILKVTHVTIGSAEMPLSVSIALDNLPFDFQEEIKEKVLYQALGLELPVREECDESDASEAVTYTPRRGRPPKAR